MKLEVNNKTLRNSLKLYKNNPITDKYVFNLINKYVNKDLDTITSLDDEITVIDENMLSKNERDIAFKLAKVHNIKAYMPIYNTLKTKFNEFKILATQYENLLTIHDLTHNLSYKQNQKLDLLLYKLTFKLIELKVNLNMDLQDIAMNDLLTYCAAIENDIVTNNYKSLSFDEWINDSKLVLR